MPPPHPPNPLMTYSASRISTWMACNRKAAWQYIAGYETPGNASTELGVATHGILEEVKKNGGYIDRTTVAGAIASEALPYVAGVDGSDPAAQFEGQFTLQGRHKWTGFIDLAVPGFVGDYKTTSDFKWAKTAEDLQYDPQAVLYAKSQFSAYPELDVAGLMWLYLRTRAPYRAMPVATTMTRAHAELGFECLEQFADEMAVAAAAAPPVSDPIARHHYVLTLAPNEDHCDAYGGCPHASRCALPMFREHRKDARPMMNLLQKLQAATALNGGAANSAPPRLVSDAPLPALLPAPAGPDATLARLAALSAAETPGTPGGNPHPMSARTDIPADPPPAPVAVATPAINPPKRGPGRPPGAKNKTVAEPARLDAEGICSPMTEIVGPSVNGGPAPAAEYRPTPTGVVLGTPAVSMPLGPSVDPTYASMPRAMPLGPSGDATLDALRAPPPPALLPAPAAPAKLIETLCVGCMPVGQAFTSIDEILEKARTMIGGSAYFGGYGYKTNGLVFQAVGQLLNAKPIETLVVPDPRLPEAALVLSFLRANAGIVVEALR